MRFRDSSVDTSGLDDRRGRSGVAIGGGAGVLGLIVYLVINLLGGGNAALRIPSDTDVSGTHESLSDLTKRCNSTGAIDRYNDCFLIKVSNEIDAVWSQTVESYVRPKLAFYEQSVATGCGNASSDVGPFYCPPDREVYIDLGFLTELQNRFGAQGRYAQAYILAHEVGHHLQMLSGTERSVRQAQKRDPAHANEYSIKLELQADCYAGVWGALADRKKNVTVTEAEVDEALRAAAAVGDDRIQRATRGSVNPETWTHGSSTQRRTAYITGFRGATLDSCPLTTR